jgi:hypothetical protein
MKYLSLFAFLSLFLVISCEDDDDLVQPQNIATTLEFRAAYGGADLAIQDATYDYPTGAQLKANLFQYYVSDLSLIDAAGNTLVLSEIDLIRYNSAADGPVVSRTYDVPAGDYVSVRFGLGVKPELNAIDPNNFAANDPLNENEFWSSVTRYVFAKIEANADLENDGTFDTGLTYHMGSDALYRTLTFTGNFTIDGTDDPRLVITADVLKALTDGTNTFDIADPAQRVIHGGNQAVGTEIWNRLADQFSLTLEQ